MQIGRQIMQIGRQIIQIGRQTMQLGRQIMQIGRQIKSFDAKTCQRKFRYLLRVCFQINFVSIPSLA